MTLDDETHNSEPESPDSFQKSKSVVKKYWVIILGFMFLGAFLLFGPSFFAKFSTRSQRYNASQILALPARDVVIVFGAGVYQDGTPTPYLRWRIGTAVDIYKTSKVKKILMSGDNSSRRHNEPAVMQRYAESLGVPSQDIVQDSAGFNTYDSCYRAHTIFGISNAIVVTQGYHLPRAIMTCNGLGIKTIGVASKNEGRDFTASYIWREFFSTVKAIIQLAFKPQPTVLGQPEPIKL